MAYTKQTWSDDPAASTPLSATRLSHMEKGIADAHTIASRSKVLYLDSYPGASDDDKLTAAIAAQKAAPGMPPILLGARKHSFNVPRPLYSGLKLVGHTSSGTKNLELAGSKYVTSWVQLGSGISSGTSSWWNSPGGAVYDVYMADFGVQGHAGSSVHQFVDFPTTATMYACQFHSLSFNFMRSVFGRKDRVCAFTQVILTGHWTANNLWDTQFTIGGSDNQLWVGGQINIGPSQSPVQRGTLSDNDYQMIFSSLSNTNVGYIYLSALNGWRGIKIAGRSGNGLQFYGGVYEGYKGSGSTSSGATLAGPGTLIRIEGGSGSFFGPNIGQGMASPESSEGGLVHMTGGEWNFYGPTFYRGGSAEASPCIFHSGGRLYVSGATRRQSETWSKRPRYRTTAAGPSAGPASFYCPDMSMVTG